MLRILSDGKIHASGEMLTLLADEFAVTEGERSRLLPSGRSRVLNGRISWARTYLKKAGLIESPKRGTYRITRPGKEALASGAQIDNDYLERYESFRSFKNLNGDSSTHTTVDGGLEKGKAKLIRPRKLQMRHLTVHSHQSTCGLPMTCSQRCSSSLRLRLNGLFLI